MGLDVINSYVAKILLAVKNGDSINRISRKIGASYSYTYEWIEELDQIGVIERTDDGVQIRDETFDDEYRALAKSVVKRGADLEDAYLLPNFAGMGYRFTKTDAIFVWTKGGYQIGRNQRDYPIFIDVLAGDVEEWTTFFEMFGLEACVGERIHEGEPGIYYVLFPREGFASEWVENGLVTPLDETVEWAEKYETNFQPALEMLDEMYDLT